jgi:hypothetical protein
MSKTRQAYFTAPNGKATLTIRRTTGKTNISVRATAKAENSKAQTGARETFPLAETAKADEAFDRLCHDASDRGWLPEAKNASKQRKQAFDTIPHAPMAEAKAKAKTA